MLANRLLTSASRAGIIKSIQQVAVTINNASSSGTATISSVDTSKTLLIWDGRVSADSGVANPQSDSYDARITLTNATTLTANRFSTSNNVTIYVTVVEFKTAAVTSVQYGTITVSSGTSNTAAISSVTTSRALCVYLGHHRTTSLGGGNSIPQSEYAVELTNSTTVTASKNTSGGDPFILSYCVIEFSSSVISSIQQVTVTGLSSTIDLTISSVDIARTCLFYRGLTTTSNTNQDYLKAVALLDSTTVRAYNGSLNGSVYATVVEFSTGVIKSVQRNVTTISSAPTQDVTISSVDTAKSFVNWLGRDPSSSPTTVAANEYLVSTKIQSATIMRFTHGGASINDKKVSWEVVEFN